MRGWMVLVVLLLLPACGDPAGGPSPDAGPADAAVLDAGPVDAAVDPTEAVFAPDRVMEVDIELAAADWDALTAQTRTALDVFGPGCLDQPFPDPFTFFPARVTLDGSPFEVSGVRKKGFLGSLSRARPSLIVKLDEYVPDQAYSGVERLVLNNNQQDPSRIHQCLGYGVLAAAGIPSPRCSYARVRVNGEDLGLYSNVEGIKKPFLRRHFADDGGLLYEGTLSDFRPGWDQTFEQKTRESTPDRSPIDAMSAALAVDDAGLLSALAPLLDVDRFLGFWAAEVLLAHWDGYAGDANNYYLYTDPATGRLEFLPWGIDATFGDREISPKSVLARGLLARRLYLLPETQARYVAALRGLLASVWSEGDLLAEIDRMEALITPVADPDGTAGLVAEIEHVRAFVLGRRAQLLAELDPQPPVWDEPLRGSVCFREVGTVHATFSTTWGSLATGNPFASGAADLTIAHEAGTPVFAHEGTLAGYDQDGRAIVLLVGQLADGTLFFVGLWLAPEALVPGVHAVDGVEVEGQVFVDPASGDPYPVAFLDGGTLSLDAASLVDGEPVSGTLDATLLFW